MQSSRKQLLKILDSIKGLPVMVIGDLMLDRYIWGQVDRISPEAPVPVVKVSKNEDRLGGAANAARNLANLGAKVTVFGFIGDDKEGELVRKLLEQSKIGTSGLIVDHGKPTCVKTRVIAHAQQVVRIDREESGAASAKFERELAKLIRKELKKYSAVLISDYGKGVISKTVMAEIQRASEAGELSLKRRPALLDPNPANYPFYCGISVAKPNRKEAEEASGIKIRDNASALKAGRDLLQKWKAEMMLISLGEDGLLIVPGSNKKGIFLETVAREVHDVSGAGDTVSALFVAALGRGATSALAGDLANIGAGVVVSEIGTAAVEPKKLKREILRLSK